MAVGGLWTELPALVDGRWRPCGGGL